MRTTIRLRLALVHTIVFAAMAIVLVSGIYALTAHSITAQSSDPRTRAEQALGLPPGTLFGKRSVRDNPRPPISPPTDGRSLSRIAAGVQAETRSALLGKLTAFSAALVAATTLLTFMIGWVMARRSLRPLRRITARAKSLSETNLHEPIAMRGPPDELRELADTFDEMLARLDRAFAGQRLFAANASHELRTPLTRIRTKLDVTLAAPDLTQQDLEELAATIRDAVDRSAALIDSLMTLARAQGQLQRHVVGLDDLARVVLAELQTETASRHISLTLSLVPCRVWGDAVLLEHLVRNVLENAVVHNVDGGWVDARTDGNGVARFRVVNSGGVISRSAIEQLFLPLHRGDSDRLHGSDGGFGLGLAIVKAVAEAHEGRVRAEPLEGGGLAIEVTFPLADQPAGHHTIAAQR